MGRKGKRARSSTTSSPDKDKSTSATHALTDDLRQAATDGQAKGSANTSVFDVLTSMRDILSQQQLILTSLVKPNSTSTDPLVVHCKLRAHLKEDEALPMPFEIANPRLLKEPWLWPIFWAHAKITRLGLIDSFGLPGPFLKAFTSSLEIAYPRSTEEQRQAISTLFSQGAYLLLCGRQSLGDGNKLTPAFVQELSLFLEPTLKEARRLLVVLDASVLGAELGAAAGKSFETAATTLDVSKFAQADADIVKRLTKEHGGKGTQRKKVDGDKSQGPRKMICKKCKKEVPAGQTMKDHRTTCKP